MKKIFATAAVAAAIAVSAPASAASWIVTNGADVAVPTNNDFKGELSGLGFTNELIGANVAIETGSWVEFYFLGSESGFFDTVSINGTSVYQETSYSTVNRFADPIFLGKFWVVGDLDVKFTNNASAGKGRDAIPGDLGFAVFTGANSSSDTLYFGYDDEAGANSDDNHDDMILRAVIVPAPVPEPATWAMMLAGIGAVGFAMRRRTRTARVSFG